MKISNNKRQLAQLLIEAGVTQFHEGSNWAAQDKSGMVWAYRDMPKRMCEIWVNKCRGLHKLQVTIPNWHQTVLSRAEFDQIVAETATDAEGWIGCNGCEPEVDRYSEVEVKFRDGKVCHGANPVRVWCWAHRGEDDDIIAYRLHKPEQQLGELCDKVTEENKHEHVNARPTIDQLLQDWRNADDFAQRKQAEADEAAAMRDGRWQAVQTRAGEMGVTVGRCGSQPPIRTYTFASGVFTSEQLKAAGLSDEDIEYLTPDKP